MASLTVSETASLDARSAQIAAYVSGLVAGEALDNASACYINSDGKVYMCGSTHLVDTLPAYAGFCFKVVPAGGAVTLFRTGTMASYSESMTPGVNLYIDSAGKLSATAVVTGDKPVAQAISDTDIYILR